MKGWLLLLSAKVLNHTLSHLYMFLTSFLNCISVAACNALPSIPSTVRKHKVLGWNDAAKDLRDKANFWYWVWSEAGSPSAGVLAVIKKKSKSRYKYEVRRLKRRREHIAREKLAKAFSIRNKKDFWQNVKIIFHEKTVIGRD